ncbi:MAG: hypothetical protein MZV70_18030 [Desulfobacterales bacterium]|nr:hypothetical protein [Desulfobacterales bacterium]
MPNHIKAVNAYRPRIAQGNTVQKAEFIRFVSRATTLLEGTVGNVLTETRDQIIAFCRMGRAVKLDGLGIFTLCVDIDGLLSINFRPDPALGSGMNIPGTFTGTHPQPRAHRHDARAVRPDVERPPPRGTDHLQRTNHPSPYTKRRLSIRQSPFFVPSRLPAPSQLFAPRAVLGAGFRNWNRCCPHRRGRRRGLRLSIRQSPFFILR